MSNADGNAGILNAGYVVCGSLAEGISATDIAGIIYSKSIRTHSSTRATTV